MRLSTDRERDDDRSVAVLHAAFAAGVNLLDTADAYCWDHKEMGHNERLIARALSTWEGDTAGISIATKGGLTRPQGGWIPDGRARHLAAACEESRRALGVERIQLYQLHALDSRTPLSTSVRALEALKSDGLIEAIGLCNVNLGQIEEARQITDIATVQVELSIWQDAALLNGVAHYCLAHGIRLLAHRPLGGPQRQRRTRSDAVLNAIAARHDATPFEIAIAWLTNLSEAITPLPGATHEASITSSSRACSLVLTHEDREQLDERFPAGRIFRRRCEPEEQPRAANSNAADEGDIVLIMGLPAAGKSTLAEKLVAEGYQRLNRDEAGGSLKGLAAALDGVLASGTPRVVLDNTYVSRKTRAEVLAVASKHARPVRCVWLTTTVEETQVNAVTRMLSRYGRLLSPQEMKRAKKNDISAIAPMVQFRYQRELEPPNTEEGFSRVDAVPFARGETTGVNRAIIVWCDGVLLRAKSTARVPSSADDVEVVSEYGALLRRYRDAGWRILGLSWQPDVGDGKVTVEQVTACFDRMRDLLNVSIEVEYCPHAAGPPACWCRKPLPGLGVVFIQRHQLDPSQCIYVGSGAQDPGFARRLGFQYRDAADFFAADPVMIEKQ